MEDMKHMTRQEFVASLRRYEHVFCVYYIVFFFMILIVFDVIYGLYCVMECM